jgi:DNA-directed RNA polymerase subunit omega
MSDITRRPMYVIPDDPEQSVYRFIIVAAKRARQLQSGQRPLLPGATKKPTVMAMEEVRRGLIQYWDPAAQQQTKDNSGGQG